MARNQTAKVATILEQLTRGSTLTSSKPQDTFHIFIGLNPYFFSRYPKEKLIQRPRFAYVTEVYPINEVFMAALVGPFVSPSPFALPESSITTSYRTQILFKKPRAQFHVAIKHPKKIITYIGKQEIHICRILHNLYFERERGEKGTCTQKIKSSLRERKNGERDGGGGGGVRIQFDDGEGRGSKAVHREPLQESEEESAGAQGKVSR